MDSFEEGFFEPVEQALEHGAVRQDVGNYTPDPVYKKIYVLVAGEAYSENSWLMAASHNQVDIEKMKDSVERIAAGYASAVNFLRKSNLLTAGSRDSLDKTVAYELNFIGVDISVVGGLVLDELYFEIKEVMAKVG